MKPDCFCLQFAFNVWCCDEVHFWGLRKVWGMFWCTPAVGGGANSVFTTTHKQAGLAHCISHMHMFWPRCTKTFFLTKKTTPETINCLHSKKKKKTRKVRQKVFKSEKTRKNANLWGNPLLQSQEPYKNKQIIWCFKAEDSLKNLHSVFRFVPIKKCSV